MNSYKLKKCGGFSEALQESKETDFPKAFSKFQVMNHLKGPSVASRNGLLGAKTFSR